jgi:hypothetical protein
MLEQNQVLITKKLKRLREKMMMKIMMISKTKMFLNNLRQTNSLNIGGKE